MRDVTSEHVIKERMWGATERRLAKRKAVNDFHVSDLQNVCTDQVDAIQVGTGSRPSRRASPLRVSR
eukprot:62335-Rhodomonas_salina.1